MCRRYSTALLLVSAFGAINLGCDVEHIADGSTGTAQPESSSANMVLQGNKQTVVADRQDVAALRAASAGAGFAPSRSAFLEAQDRRLKYFAMAIALGLRDNGIGPAIKAAVGKQFDGTYDALWNHIRGLSSQGATIRDVIATKFDRATRDVLSVEQIEQVSLLQLSIPCNFDKWDGRSPILVAYAPTAIDDDDWTTITAYDSKLNAIQLDARVEPTVPVIVVGLNERVDPATNERYKTGVVEVKDGPAPRSVQIPTKTAPISVSGKPQTPSLLAAPETAASTAAIAGNPFYLEWFWCNYDHDPWPKGAGEFEFFVLTDLNKSVKVRFENIEEKRYYRLGQLLANYYSELGKYLSLNILEDDWNGLNATVKLHIEKYGITADAEWKIDSGDDNLGKMELIDMSNGPLYLNRYTQPTASNMYPISDTRFTFWWSWKQDYAITSFPYTQQNRTTGKGDDWTGSYNDGEDVAYLLEVNQQGTYDISLCSPYTNYDTILRIWDRYGETGQVSDDDYTCGVSVAHSGLHDVPLAPGLYYLEIGGYAAQSGNYQITVTKQ